MAIYQGVNGVNREIKQIFEGVGGVNREVKARWEGVGGVNRRVLSATPMLLIPAMNSMSDSNGTITAGVTTQAIYNNKIKVDFPYKLTRGEALKDDSGWMCVAMSFTSHAGNTQSMAWWQFVWNRSVKVTSVIFNEKRYIDRGTIPKTYSYEIDVSYDGTNFVVQKSKTFPIANNERYVYSTDNATFNSVDLPTARIRGIRLRCTTATQNGWPSTTFMEPNNLRIYGLY